MNFMVPAPLSTPWSEALSSLAQAPGEPFQSSSSCLCPRELPGGGRAGSVWEKFGSSRQSRQALKLNRTDGMLEVRPRTHAGQARAKVQLKRGVEVGYCRESA